MRKGTLERFWKENLGKVNCPSVAVFILEASADSEHRLKAKN